MVKHYVTNRWRRFTIQCHLIPTNRLKRITKIDNEVRKKQRKKKELHEIILPSRQHHATLFWYICAVVVAR